MYFVLHDMPTVYTWIDNVKNLRSLIMAETKIDYLEIAKAEQIGYLQAMPGINLIKAETKQEYDEFVKKTFKEKIIIETHLVSGGVYRTTNFSKLFFELSNTSRYRETQKLIGDAFLSKYKESINCNVSENLYEFQYLPTYAQDNFLKNVISSYLLSLPPSSETGLTIHIEALKNVSSFRDYVKKNDLSCLFFEFLNTHKLEKKFADNFFQKNQSNFSRIFLNIIPSSAAEPENQKEKIIKNLCYYYIIFREKNSNISLDNFENWIKNLHFLFGHDNQTNADLDLRSLNDYIKKSHFISPEDIYSNNRARLIECMTQIIPNIAFLSDIEKKDFIKKLLLAFEKNGLRKDKIFILNSFLGFVKSNLDIFYKHYKPTEPKTSVELFKYLINGNSSVYNKNSEQDQNLKIYLYEFQRLVRQKQLSVLKEVFGFLFLKKLTTDDLEYLLFVFDFQMADDKKIQKIVEYFNGIWEPGKTIIDNGYDVNIEKAQESIIYAAAKWLLGSRNIQEFGASQAILTKFGLLHEAPGSVMTEIGNLILIADNARTAGNVRKLIHSICLPLQPLAKEWFVLLPSEKNWVIIGLRLLVPILIASVIIALGFLLISLIVSMPAVFELLMIIPLAYFGFFSASMSIILRDYVYESIMNYRYKGLYNRPEFQVNNALITVFGEKLAHEIRNYYVNEFKESDRLIKEFETRLKDKNIASEEENKYLLINGAPRKEELLEEWETLTARHKTKLASKEELNNLIKRRVKLDSVISSDLDKKERDKYIESYCKSLRSSSSPVFFKSMSTSKDLFRSRFQREKMQKLHIINEMQNSVSSDGEIDLVRAKV